ncbi:hypothetical protein P12x_001094 [Tundrisphaera lichenicola]|uniref:hypothetical protein n=1 Tax=Tundrisphaera lichenicola TaxID=2029860 RepID=UPI003EBDD34B
MSKAVTLRYAIVASVLAGCSTMRSAEDRHPGATDQSDKAVTRVFPASATRVAQAMGRVMSQDPILEDVQVAVDPQSNESRPLSAAERQRLGRSRLAVNARDKNYNIKAKSKDGLSVGAVVYLKGESNAEVSLLYGPGGDPEMSRAILDEVEVALAAPVEDPGVSQASGTRAASRKSEKR